MADNTEHNPPALNTTPSTMLSFVAWIAGIAACVLPFLAAMAYGLSGFAFAVVLEASALVMMHRRYRFSLRTFLIVTAIFCVWLGIKTTRDSQQQHVIKVLEDAGGRFTLRDQSPDFPWNVWADRYALSFYNLRQPVTEEDMRQLAMFTSASLCDLHLENAGIDDESLKHFQHLSQLQFLSLANQTYYGGGRIAKDFQNSITDAGIAQLPAFPRLFGIDSSGTDVTDAVIDKILEWPNLHWIKLNGTRVTGLGFSRLVRLKQLATVDLEGCPISSEGFRELSGLFQLNSLDLVNAHMTDADLDALSQLPQIDLLRMNQNSISNEAKSRFVQQHPRCRIE